MGDISSLEGYKQKKLDNKITEDVESIIVILDYTIRALSFFKHYKPLVQLLAELEAHKKYFEFQKKKYEKK